MKEREKIRWCIYEYSFGKIAVACTGKGVCKISLLPSKNSRITAQDFFSWLQTRFHNPILKKCEQKHCDIVCQLELYSRGNLTMFSAPIDLRANDLQSRVLREIGKIPYGETRSYSDIAGRVGDVDYRQVAAVNRFNPLPIVIPCHRVICKNGSLGFYTSSNRLKSNLIKMEEANKNVDRSLSEQ